MNLKTVCYPPAGLFLECSALPLTHAGYIWAKPRAGGEAGLTWIWKCKCGAAGRKWQDRESDARELWDEHVRRSN